MPITSSDTLVLFRKAPLIVADYMEVVQVLAREFCASAGVVRVEKVVASAMQREAEDSTCVGRDLAVPHARVADLSCAGIYIARMECPVGWPVEPVRLVAFLAVPEEKPEMYLQMLSQLVRWWMSQCAEYGDGVHFQPMPVLVNSLAERVCSSC